MVLTDNLNLLVDDNSTLNLKVSQSPTTDFDTIFLALSHPIRRSILENLKRQSEPLIYLAFKYKISLPAITQHIKLLEKSGLARTHRRGRNKFVSLEIASLKGVYKYTEGFISTWDESYQNFKRNMESTHIGRLRLSEEED